MNVVAEFPREADKARDMFSELGLSTDGNPARKSYDVYLANNEVASLRGFIDAKLEALMDGLVISDSDFDKFDEATEKLWILKNYVRIRLKE